MNKTNPSPRCLASHWPRQAQGVKSGEDQNVTELAGHFLHSLLDDASNKETCGWQNPI